MTGMWLQEKLKRNQVKLYSTFSALLIQRKIRLLMIKVFVIVLDRESAVRSVNFAVGETGAH